MIHLQLARWHWALHASPPSLATALAEQYAAFRREAGDDVDLTLDLAVEWEDDGGSVLAANLLKRGEEYLLDGHKFYGMIQLHQRRAALRLHAAHAMREAEYFLRVVAALWAYEAGGLLVHCAAVQAGPDTFLLVGQSGSGKSTAVALSHAAGKATALGDDLVLLRPEGSGWRAYGTPFWNADTVERRGQTSDGLVTGIYKLVKDRDIYVEPMSLAAGTAELLANAPVVNDRPELAGGLIARCRAVVQSTGLQRLHFRRDAGFWAVLPGQVEAGEA